MRAIPEHMSPADFARHCDVSRAAVSQWKVNGILTQSAFTRPEKKGKLITAIALVEVGKNRDLGQSLGNGITTQTGLDVPADPGPIDEVSPAPQSANDQPTELDLAGAAPQSQAAAPPQSRGPSLVTYDNDPLKAARLEREQRKNRLEAIEEAQAHGLLMDAAEARQQMARISGMMLTVFEAALPDFAAKIAEQFQVPQRDALHLLRNEFRVIRQKAADKQREQAASEDLETPVSVSASQVRN
jgi:hypothetical protein